MLLVGLGGRTRFAREEVVTAVALEPVEVAVPGHAAEADETLAVAAGADVGFVVSQGGVECGMHDQEAEQ